MEEDIDDLLESFGDSPQKGASQNQLHSFKYEVPN